MDFKRRTEKTLLVGALLKLATSLNATKRNVVTHIEVKITDAMLTFTLVCNGNYKAEEYQAEKQKKHLEKVLKKPIALNFKYITN